MNRHIGTATLAAAIFFAAVGATAAQDPPVKVKVKLDAEHEACIKACEACVKACNTCAKHCAALVKAGDKTHADPLRNALDCADIAAACAKVASRKGPALVGVCDVCVSACERSIVACADSSHAEMKATVKACRECAAETLALRKHVMAKKK